MRWCAVVHVSCSVGVSESTFFIVSYGRRLLRHLMLLIVILSASLSCSSYIKSLMLRERPSLNRRIWT